jgi:hypothetical protein
MPHAVTTVTPPDESEQKQDEQNREEGKEEMMRVRTNRIRRIGMKMGRPEHPDDRRDNQREHRHARQQMKPMMQTPMTASPALFVMVGRWGIGGLIDGKFFADPDAEFGHVSSSG